MLNRINKLIIAFLLVSGALYVVLMNSEPAVLHATPGWEIKGSAGVMYLALFGLGILVTAIVALFFGVKAHLRERRLHSQGLQRQAFYEGMLKARAAAIGAEWHKARVAWEYLIKKDPTDIIARVELSRCLQSAGEFDEALRVLDAARAAEPKNVEVLFRAAELNISRGNKTAAIDNLALILSEVASRRAAAMARDLSEELDRLSDALEYHERVTALDGATPDTDATRARLELKRLLRDFQGDKGKLREELRAFCKRYADYVPGLQKMAALEVEAHNSEEAANWFVKAAKASKSSAYWNEISRLWLKQNLPDRALAAARSATKETKGEARLIAELDLARIYIELQQLEQARRVLDGFPELARTLGVAVPQDLWQQHLILRGYQLSQTGSSTEAAKIWRLLARPDLEGDLDEMGTGHAANGDAPAPRLSTP